MFISLLFCKKKQSLPIGVQFKCPSVNSSCFVLFFLLYIFNYSNNHKLSFFSFLTYSILNFYFNYVLPLIHKLNNKRMFVSVSSYLFGIPLNIQKKTFEFDISLLLHPKHEYELCKSEICRICTQNTRSQFEIGTFFYWFVKQLINLLI